MSVVVDRGEYIIYKGYMYIGPGVVRIFESGRMILSKFDVVVDESLSNGFMKTNKPWKGEASTKIVGK